MFSTERREPLLSMPSTAGAPPRVSVIIPTYNNACFLPQALDSVLSQNYDDYEIIVVDDGSTDATSVVLESYADRIRMVHQENAGSAAARNAGLELALGEFIVFLDADDLLLPGKLRQQAAHLQLRPWLGYVHSGWRKINERGEVLRDVEPWTYAPQLDLRSWLQYKPVQLGAMMFRRLWLDSVGGLDPALRQSHDVDLLLRLSLAGCRGEWLYRPTICYRQHSGSTIHGFATEQARSLLAVLDKFFALASVPDEIQRQKKHTYYYTTLWLAWHLFRNASLSEMVSHLRLNIDLGFHTGPDETFLTVLDWLTYFVRWNEEDGHPVPDLPSLLPHFRAALKLESDEWNCLERFMQWWLGRRPFCEGSAYGQPQAAWPLFRRAVGTEAGQETVAAEAMLDWWVDVWVYYREGRYDEAVRGVAHYTGFGDEAYVQLVTFALQGEPEPPTAGLISQVWRDARARGVVSEGDDRAFFERLPPIRPPTVSVIVPTYQSAGYVGRAVDSIYAQTYDDYEIIVVDDGSTDETESALHPYRGRLRYVYQENQGVSAARNAGLSRAGGEYLLFLDSDDTILPDKLAQQVACLETDPELDVIHSGWRVVDQLGNALRVVEPWHQTPELGLESWLNWKPVFLGAMLFRREALMRTAGFDPELQQAEDTDLMLRLALAGRKMGWLKTSTVCYRQHSANVTRNGKQQAESLTRVLDEFYGRQELPVTVRRSEGSVRYYTDLWLAWHLYQTGHGDEVAHYLRRTLANTSEEKPRLIVQRWLFQLECCARQEGTTINEPREWLPHFRSALALEPNERGTLEEAVVGWLSQWPLVVDNDGAGLREHQSLFDAALELERDGHVACAGQWFTWWVLVWRFYVAGKREEATRNLSHFRRLSEQQLVKLAQAAVLWRPNDIQIDRIREFWQDITGNQLVPSSAQHGVTAIYLTYFGQALLGRHWRLAWRGLARALGVGIRAGALRAWAQFLWSGVAYTLEKPRRWGRMRQRTGETPLQMLPR